MMTKKRWENVNLRQAVATPHNIAGYQVLPLNTFVPRDNGRQVLEVILSVKTAVFCFDVHSLKFVSISSIDNKPALVKIYATYYYPSQWWRIILHLAFVN